MSCETRKISIFILNLLIKDTRCAPIVPMLERFRRLTVFTTSEIESVSSRLEDILRHKTIPLVIRTRLERALLVRRHLKPISISLLRDTFFKTSWILPQPSTNQRVGLKNLGNTCYMNAAFQALYACAPFRQCILSSLGGNSFCVELRRLLR